MLTEEQKKEALEEHNEGIKEFQTELEDMGKELGRNTSVYQKMQTIFETMDSFTESEIFELNEYWRKNEEKETQGK